MAITLPKAKTVATQLSPSIMVIYGPPKTGKTKMLTKLDDCLILDLEGGTKRYDAMAQGSSSYNEFQEVLVALATEYAEKGNKPVYKYGAIDTLDVLEDFAIHKAAELYRQTPMGKTWYAKNYKSPGILLPEGEPINNLPNGAGYGYIRNAMQWYIDVLSKFFKYLILVGHVKDKKVAATEGVEEVTVNTLALTGKLAWLVPAKADAVGYVYRDNKGVLMISFKSQENQPTSGSRPEHIAGQKFPFDDWGKIYID